VISLRGMDPDLRPYAEYALEIARWYGLDPVVTSVFRSWAEQYQLYLRFKAGKSAWPANFPGDSAHQYGLAFDSWVEPDHQALWAAIRRYVGWYVPPGDVIHAEVPGWRDLIA